MNNPFHIFLSESEAHSYRPGDGDVKEGNTGDGFAEKLAVRQIKVTVEKKKDDMEGTSIKR